jgi:hypothetical protein
MWRSHRICLMLLVGTILGQPGAKPIVPFADYHQHLFSPAKAAALYDPPLPAIALPPDLTSFIEARERAQNDESRLASLYAKDALMLNTQDSDAPSWIRGNQAVAKETAQHGRRRGPFRDVRVFVYPRASFRSATANQLKTPMVVHLWTDPAYEKEGAQHAQIFLDRLLPLVPDVTIQIAHLAGGGRATPSALAVFANAIAKGDPRTKHLYFDLATITEGESAEGLKGDARFIRQIGVDRILYGTDTSPPNPPARVSWASIRSLVPLTDQEFRSIADNVAPYLQ